MTARLNVKAFALAGGFLWGFSVLLTGLMARFLNWGNDWVYLLSSIYIGYKATVPGSILGACYGFVDGLIGGALLAWLYNKFNPS